MTDTSQQHLGQYDVDVGPDPQERIRQPPSTISIVANADQFITDARPAVGWGIDKDKLPDISGFNWELEDDYRGLATVPLWQPAGPDRWDSDREEPEKIAPNGRLLIAGHEDSTPLDEFLRNHALTEVSLPDYYTQIESMDPVHRWSVDGVTHLNGHFIKRCIRLSNGSGRIDTERTNLVLTDTGDVIVTGPRGAFIVPVFARGGQTLPEPPDGVTHRIAEFNIPEENPKYRTALCRYLTRLNESPYPEPTSYVDLQHSIGKNSPISHRFKTAESPIDLTEKHLDIIRKHTASAAETEGVHTTEHDGILFTALVNDLPGPIGTEVTLDREAPHANRDQLTGIVAGYRTEWNVVKRLKGFNGRKVPTELQHWLQIAIIEPDGTVALEKRQIACFDLD